MAENEGSTVPDITLERVGNLPTYSFVSGLESGQHIFFLITVGGKAAGVDFLCSSEGWKVADIVFWKKLLRKTVSAIFQPSKLHKK